MAPSTCTTAGRACESCAPCVQPRSSKRSRAEGKSALVHFHAPARYNKQVFSKKYGVDHARFTHSSKAIIYASTMENDTIRYHSIHDNKYLRYFQGHKRKCVRLAGSWPALGSSG